MTTLNIGPGIEMPVELLTDSTAVLAKKGAGKTNLGVVIVEEAYKVGLPVTVIDPKGDWYGIRAGTDGTPNGGLPIPVFGGLHGDIPLEATAGTYTARLVRERNLSVVLDVSEFTGAERRRFLTAFAGELYRHESRTTMLLMLEEAHEYIPQSVTGEDAKMVGVFEKIVKLGRWKGIGITMMTQRSASLNKNVLTQVDNLFMMRTGSPQDRAAVQSWLAGHDGAKAIVDSLPGLQTGEFVLWAPERGEPIHGRARMRATFDAGATPKIGEAPQQIATLADIDLAGITAAMHDTIEKAKADDPTELRRQLAERNQRVAVLEQDVSIIEAKLDDALSNFVPVEVVVQVVPASVVAALARARAELLELHKVVSEALEEAQAVNDAAPEPVAARPTKPVQPLPVPAPEIPDTVYRAAFESASSSIVITEHSLTPTMRNILRVLAQFPKPLTAKQVTARGGPSWKSSSFKGALPQLRRAGLLEEGPELTITEHGRRTVGPVEAPPVGRALLDWWRPRLSPTEHGILRALVDVWPESLSAFAATEAAGYSATSSSAKSAVPALRNQELIYGTNDALRADDVFGEAS